MKKITELTRTFTCYRNNQIYLEVPTPAFDLAILFNPCSMQEARDIAIDDFSDLTNYIDRTKKKYNLDRIDVAYLIGDTGEEVYAGER